MINHKDQIYLEEEVEERVAEFYKGILIEDREAAVAQTNEGRRSPLLNLLIVMNGCIFDMID